MQREQPSANGQVAAQLSLPPEGERMAKVKFLQDTVHPDYGEIKEGEVLSVAREYVEQYRIAGLAEESDEELSREAIEPEA